jgi:hypothetical protein
MQKTLLLIFLSLFIKAQAQLDYSLTNSRSTYAELTGATNVSVDAWSNASVRSLPFTFKFFGQSYNNIYITYDGVYFSDTGSDYIFYGTDNFKPKGNIPTESPITFVVTGSAPNRVFKVQYKDISEATVGSSYVYSINNQIWLYENTNVIEYRFGNSIITDPKFNAFYIGLIDGDDEPYLSIDNNAAAPTLIRVTTTPKGLPTYPTSGQVYTLTPKRTAIAPLNTLPYLFVQGESSFTIKSNEAFKITALDINGRDITKSLKLDSNNGKYSLDGCAAGMYILNIEVGNQIFTEKILLQ